ncbi:MAG: dockerin type I domain-containing protein, partial [Ruminococcus sp.]|nr:dockerin type I domain-containing protein [Ruminococcus sp.]
DGFRFDAAKHIELPSDNDKTKSDFWSVIINGIKEKKSDVFCYGEILNSAATDITNYTEYIAITDNRTGNYALSMAKSKNAKSLSKNTYMMGAAAADSVLWAESHDTYMNEGTDAIDNSIIYKAWAITGARAESTSLYLARPNSKMGLASTDDGWKSKTVSEINKFKNYFMGEGESLSYSGKTAYIERGTKGVSISKLDGEGSVSLEAKSMEDGTYKDQITGNTFTVKDGIISGEVGSTCVAVVYNPEPEKPTVTVTIGDADLDGEITVNDVTMVQKYIAELEKPEYIKVTGDTNGDGTVDINDASTIQMYLAEMPVESLVGKTVKVEK